MLYGSKSNNKKLIKINQINKRVYCANHWMHRVLVKCGNKANSILCSVACTVQRQCILKRNYSSLAKCKALHFSKKCHFYNIGWNISRTDCNHSNALVTTAVGSVYWWRFPQKYITFTQAYRLWQAAVERDEIQFHVESFRLIDRAGCQLFWSRIFRDFSQFLLL